MTLTLILMRHAKSDWDDPTMDDHDRPLNARGRRDAPRMAEWLAQTGAVPEHALCSTATRARETLEGVAPTIPTSFKGELYLASPEVILRVLRAASPERQIIIGHNPGIAYFAHQIVASQPDHRRFADFPTASTLVVDFDIDDWGELRPGTGRVRAFATPHDLAE